MKKKILMLVLLLVSLASYAALVKDHKSTYTQPNGEVINLTTTGDEFFRQVKDQDGFTVLRNNDDGYLYYAVLKDGNLVMSDVKVSATNKSRSSQFRKDITISQGEYLKRKQAFYPAKSELRATQRGFAGNMKNIVLFVYWPGNAQFTSSDVATYTTMYNAASNSVKDFYSKVSYGKSTVESTVNTTVQVQSPYNRDQVANGSIDINKFLYDVLKKAISENKIPSGSYDGNNDGYVDNVSFWIQGESGEWSSALWPQKNWLAGSYGNLTIGGKKVYDVVSSPVDRRDFPTACHELGHAFGAPDLYSYTNQSTTATGPWDNMSSVIGPVHSGIFLNSTYWGWAGTIPTVTAGTHTLQAVATSGTNSAVRINIPGRTDEYLVVENRYKTGYDSALPESGLIIYRIHPRGNDDWGFPLGNSANEPYEIYAFRPYDNIFNGNYAALAQGNETGYTEASYKVNSYDNTGIRLFTTDNKDPGIRIHNVSAAGSSMSFSVEFYTPTEDNSLIGFDYASSVGAYGAYGSEVVKMAVKMTTADLKGAKQIKGVRFYGATFEANTITSCKVSIVKGGANPEAGTKVYTGSVSAANYKTDDWTEHTLSTPVNIEASATYWLYLEIQPSKETTIYSADAGKGKVGKNYMFYNTWQDITTWSGAWDANLNIQARVDGSTVTPPDTSVVIPPTGFEMGYTEKFNEAIYNQNGDAFLCAIKLTPTELKKYAGNLELTHVKYYLANDPEGGGINSISAWVYEDLGNGQTAYVTESAEVTTGFKFDGWNYLEVEPKLLDKNKSYIIGYYIDWNGGAYAGMSTDLAAANDGKANLVGYPVYDSKNVFTGWEWYTLKEWSAEYFGNKAWSLRALFKGNSDLEDETKTSQAIELVGNYPNPFNPTTTINFALNSTEQVKVSIFNAKGEFVKELLNTKLAKGKHSVDFDGSALNSGVYFTVVKGAGQTLVNKMMLLK